MTFLPPASGRNARPLLRLLGLGLAALFLLTSAPRAGGYVTETSQIRWNDVGGLRWNDVGGLRWNDVGGLRWNDVGGLRWNDVGGVLFNDSSGLRRNDVGGLRWNDVGGTEFDTAMTTGWTALDPELVAVFSTLPDSSSIDVVITYRSAPTAADLQALNSLGILGGTIYRRLPIVVVNATRQQIQAIASIPAVRSVYANRTLSIFDQESAALIGLPEAAVDPELAAPGGGSLTGAGVTIAVLDTGVDGTHPDLPYGSKLVNNVRLSVALGSAPGFVHPLPVEGIANTDLVLGHGTAVASVAAGSGAASGGAYRGVAPSASVLGLSAGDLVIINVLEGFDYILDNKDRFGIRVVNCSWGTDGFFDADDPVNIATRLLYDAGITVVFASGNHGPAPDTLNPYSVAPWVIGVGSVRKDGRLSSFSSRGIFEEVLYHPVLVAPGEGIIAAQPASLGGVNGVLGVADPQGGTTVPPEYATYYTAVSGTSFAAPHVAGVVALLLQASPSLTPGTIKQMLQQTATPIITHDRADIGAGRLDAWAAIAKAADGGRPFGSYFPGWMDARPYRYDYAPAIVTSGTAPAGGSVTVPVSVLGPVASWQMTLSWGTLPGLSDLDLRVVDSWGVEVARSDSFNGLSLFGRTEGVHLLGAVPAGLSVEVSFKAGTGLTDQPFEIRQETAVARLTAYNDLNLLPPATLDRLARAVSRHVIDGRGNRFAPADALTRGELARSLALTTERPQRIPSHPTFPDVHAGDSCYPFVETIAGARAGSILMAPRTGSSFKPNEGVTRLDFAVAAVRAAGLEGEAQEQAGEILAVSDLDAIPYGLRGYIGVALERGLIETLIGRGLRQFVPNGTVSRLDAGRYLLRLLDLRSGTIASQPPVPLGRTEPSPPRPGPGNPEPPPPPSRPKIQAPGTPA